MPVFPSYVPPANTPGSLITTPYQYEFRGLVFGSGTNYITEKVSGIHGMPGSIDTDLPRNLDHGADPSVLLMGKRVMQFDMKILGSMGIDIEQKLEVARKTFQVPRKRHSRDLDAFVFQRPGEPLKVLWGRCTKRDFPSDYDTAHGLSAGSVELTFPDPLIYALQSTSIQSVAAATVLTTTVNPVNGGDYVDGAAPTIQIDGPATNPRIQSTTDEGRTLRVDISLSTVDSLRINAKTKKVEVRRGLAGAWQDAWVYVRSDNQWWALLPGINTVTYTRDSTNAAASSTMTVTWNDTFA